MFSLSLFLFLSFSLSSYYKELKLNWCRAFFNWCINNDDDDTTKLQHSFKYRRRVCRESRHLSASFVHSFVRSLTHFLARSHMLELLEQPVAAGFSAIGKRRSWPIWSSIHEPDDRQTSMQRPCLFLPDFLTSPFATCLWWLVVPRCRNPYHTRRS